MTGRRERVRQRFLNEGLEHFAPHEALELMLYYVVPRQDVNPLAHRLIEAFGTLNGVLEAPVALLRDVPGVGDAVATYLHLLPAFMRFCMTDRAKQTALQLDTFKDAGAFCAAQLAGLPNESFLLVCLDAQNRICGHRILWEGTVDETPAYPRRILTEAMRFNAQSVIIAHNHPGGTPAFSPSDIEVTRQITFALSALNIKLIEHFLVAPDGVFIAMGSVTGR